jgi:hypothetical protein
MNLAKRNHYNPCLWTAHWNQHYYQCAIAGAADSLSARQQRVFALSVKSGKIFEVAVENIHFDKHLGIAEISREQAEGFARRHHPDRYEQFVRDNQSAPYPVAIDFEQILVALENGPPYKVLLNVIKRQDLASPEEKAFLSAFVLLQLLRSHAIMNSTLEWHRELGMSKFEHFITLKWTLSNPDTLLAALTPLVMSHWTLFAAPAHTFPLCDSPILVKPGSIMVALSPTLLLEILTRVPAGPHQWRIDDGMPSRKFAEYRVRTIGNTFREIIFGTRDILEEWRATTAFEKRVVLARDMKSYNRLVATRGKEELWLLNAYGNQD